MSFKRWAIKPAELKGLSREGLLLLLARAAMRVGPWRPRQKAAAWTAALERLVSGRAPSASMVAGLHWGEALEAPSIEDDCRTYAMWALREGLELSQEPDERVLARAVPQALKISASIPAKLVHAGRIKGADALDRACTAIWQAMRHDLPLLRQATGIKSVQALRRLGALWPGKPPTWVPAR